MAIDDPTPAGDVHPPSADAAPTRRPGLPPMPSVHGEAPTVGFLELFYDLVFVASTMVLSNAFSERLTWRWAGVCAIVFALVWLLWFHTTLLMNVERRDDFGHRTLVLVQMFLIAMTTLAFVDRNYTATDYLGGTYGAARDRRRAHVPPGPQALRRRRRVGPPAPQPAAARRRC